jgi:hypothetical protein
MRGDPHQWAIIAAPRHPVVAHTLRHILNNIEWRDDATIQLEVECVTGARPLAVAARDAHTTWYRAVAGPPVLFQAFQELLCSPWCVVAFA